MQNGKISLLQNPTTVEIGEWIINNANKVAAAKRIKNTTKATIYAVEEADFATPYMVKYAKDNDLNILVSISGEINTID